MHRKRRRHRAGIRESDRMSFPPAPMMSTEITGENGRKALFPAVPVYD